MSFDIIVILITSVVIYISGNYFATASSRVGDHFRLPKSVKGATLDAVASSFPELMIAIFSVISFQQFEVGIGTIVGSAFFNLLIIPGISVLVAPVVFRVSKEVVSRDALFYNISVAALLAALLYSQMWAVLIPVLFLVLYIAYVTMVAAHTHKYRKESEKVDTKIYLTREFFIGAINMVVMGTAAFYLTESAISFANHIGIPAVVVAFTVIAAATSLPDAVISITNARQGRTDDAAANVFGSNIFDILIGLAVPVLLLFFLSGEAVEIVFEQIEIIIGLLVATILVTYLLVRDYTLGKIEAWSMIILYILFVVYVFSI
jgi:cation:H+ antiporter